MRLRLQDQGALPPMATLAEEPRAEVDAEFHRHVEAWHAAVLHLHARKVMDTPIAIADHGGDLAAGGPPRRPWRRARCGDGSRTR